MTRESVARFSAWCIALYAFDVLTPVVDILRLPLLRSVGPMTLSTPLIIASLCILIHLAQRKNKPILGVGEILLSGVLFFWAGLEIIGASGRGVTNFDQILEFIPFLLALMASRLHVKLFGDASILVSAMVFVGSLMVLVQTVLLLSLSIGIQSSIIDTGEVSGRNGMAMLLPVCIWLLAWIPLNRWPVFHLRYNLLVLLALANALLSSGRMALLVLMCCVLVGAILHWPLIRRILRAILIPASIVLMVVVGYSFPIVQALNEQGVWGSGDDVLSVFSRAYSNFLLLGMLEQDPLLGIGWAKVAATKAFGYMGHSLYVNLLSAYGLIGALAAVCALSFGLLKAHGENREAATHLLFLAILITSFVNNVHAYFGVVIALIGTLKVTNTHNNQCYELKPSRVSF